MKRLLPALLPALGLLLASCSGAPDYRGWAFTTYAPESGEGLRLQLSRDRESLFGTWTLGAVYGLAEGRATAATGVSIQLYGPGTGRPAASFDGRFERGESQLVGRLAPAGASPGPETRLLADPALRAELRGARLLASTREGLGKVGDATSFAYLGFEPAGDADFLAWYRTTFQGGRKLEDAMATERDGFLGAFKADIPTRKELEAPVFPWYYEGRQCLVLANPRLLVMGLRLATYEGGAHGGQAIRYAVIDRAGKRLLGPDDFLVEGWREGILPLLERNAKGALGLSADQPFTEATFFEDALRPSGDFFVTPAGIGFDYDQYEVAPYSSGSFWFVVPFGDLDGLLKPGVLAAWGLGGEGAAK